MALARSVVYAGKGSISKGKTMNTPRIILSVLISIGASAAPLFGTVIADSVVDFSGVQGQDNWYYGYWDRTNDADGVYQSNEMQAMAQFLTAPSGDYGPSLHSPCWRVQDGAYWTALWDRGGHPNGTNGNAGHLPIEHWTIRRWSSEIAGQIDIDARLGCSDGFFCHIAGRIFVDGVEVFSQFHPFGQPPQSYFVTAPVNVGSKVDFVFDPNGWDVDDMSYFTASISPEPTSALLLGIGAAIALSRRRYR